MNFIALKMLFEKSLYDDSEWAFNADSHNTRTHKKPK